MNRQLNMFAGKKARDKGIAKATAHAEATEPGWSDRALEMIRAYPAPGRMFMAEDVSRWAVAQGFNPPPNGRAWGGVFSRAARQGIIKRVGFAAVTNPAAHCTPASVWVMA